MHLPLWQENPQMHGFFTEHTDMSKPSSSSSSISSFSHLILAYFPSFSYPASTLKPPASSSSISSRMDAHSGRRCNSLSPTFRPRFSIQEVLPRHGGQRISFIFKKQDI